MASRYGSQKEKARQKTCFFLSFLLVEARVYVVDIFLVQTVFGEAQAFTEAYKMEITSLQMRHSILMESLVA